MNVEVVSTPLDDAPFARTDDVYVGAGTRLRAKGDDLPCDVDFTLTVADGRLVVDELALRRRPNGPAIGPDTLRAVSIPRLIAEAVTALWTPGEPMTVTVGGLRLAVVNSRRPANPIADYAALWRTVKNRRGQGRALADEDLPTVAEIYRANPRRGFVAVKEHFNIGRSTAAEYVKRAREAGLLED
jgi:hypothetical protein